MSERVKVNTSEWERLGKRGHEIGEWSEEVRGRKERVNKGGRNLDNA